MGVHTSPSRMTGNLPRYYVTDTLEEDAGGGNLRIWNYCRRNGVLVPQFEVIIPSQSMLLVGRKICDLAQTIFDGDQLRMPGQHVH